MQLLNSSIECFGRVCTAQGKCDSGNGQSSCCGDGIVSANEICDDGSAGCCIRCQIIAAAGNKTEKIVTSLDILFIHFIGISCNDNNPCSNSMCNELGSCVSNSKPEGTICGASGSNCTVVCKIGYFAVS